MQQPKLESASRVSPQKTEEDQLHGESYFPSLIGLQPVTHIDVCSSLPLHESQTSTKTLRSELNVGSQSVLKSKSQLEVMSAQDIELQPEALPEPQSQGLPKILKLVQDCTGLQSQLHSKTQALLNTNTSQCQFAVHSSVVVPEVSPLAPVSSVPSLACSLHTTAQSLSSAACLEDGTPSAGKDRNVSEMSTSSCTAESERTGSSEVMFSTLGQVGASVSQSSNNTPNSVSKVPVLSATAGITCIEESTHSASIPGPHLDEGTSSYDLSGLELVELDPEVMVQLVPQQVCTIPQRSRGKDGTSQRKSARADGVQSFTTTANSCNSKWQRHETLKLIELYKENQHYFEDQHYKKKTVWQMLAAKLAKVSKSKFRYTGTQVSNRWKNLTKMYRDCIQGVPWVSKCQYFDQLQSVFGDSKVIASSQSLKQRRQTHSLRRRRPASATSGFVTIAPKKPAHQASILSTSPVDQTSFLAGNEQTIPVLQTVSATEPKHFTDVVSAVRKVHEEQKKRDAWKLDQLERMHKEKMQLFSQFLDLLKEHHQKN